MNALSPAQAARHALRTLGDDASAADLSDFALGACPYDLDSAEGQEWAEGLEGAILDVLA